MHLFGFIRRILEFSHCLNSKLEKTIRNSEFCVPGRDSNPVRTAHKFHSSPVNLATPSREELGVPWCRLPSDGGDGKGKAVCASVK